MIVRFYGLGNSSTCFFLSEYQLETESLSQCEQLRAVSSAQGHEHVPQCSEDGRFRCINLTNIVYTIIYYRKAPWYVVEKFESKNVILAGMVSVIVEGNVGV